MFFAFAYFPQTQLGGSLINIPASESQDDLFAFQLNNHPIIKMPSPAVSVYFLASCNLSSHFLYLFLLYTILGLNYKTLAA